MVAMLTGPAIYSRLMLLSYRHSAGVSKSSFISRLAECGLLRYRGSRGGQATRARRAAQPILKPPQVNRTVELPGAIPTISSRCPTADNNRRSDAVTPVLIHGHHEVNGHRPRCLVDVTRQAASACSTCLSSHDNLPTLYVLNAAALTKSHAVEHLAADLTGYNYYYY